MISASTRSAKETWPLSTGARSNPPLLDEEQVGLDRQETVPFLDGARVSELRARHLPSSQGERLIFSLLTCGCPCP